MTGLKVTSKQMVDDARSRIEEIETQDGIAMVGDPDGNWVEFIENGATVGPHRRSA